jgi:hypothetical protein
MPTIKILASQYEDYDDCLAAAAEDYAATHGLKGWDLEPRWEDDANRETILLTVPQRATPKEETTMEPDADEDEDESRALASDDAEALAQRLAGELLEAGLSEFADSDWDVARGIYDQATRELRLSAMRRAEELARG